MLHEKVKAAKPQSPLQQRERSWDLLRFASAKPPAVALAAIKLAWPVYAWRVVVPRPRKHSRDPIQRAVLHLAGCGLGNRDEVARLLGLPLTLVEYVQQELTKEELLDARNALTAQGRKADLENSAEFDVSELETGWIFRDALSGDVLPGFYQGNLPMAPMAAWQEAKPLPFDPAWSSPPSIKAVVVAMRLLARLQRYEPENNDPSGFEMDSFDPEAMEVVQWEEATDQKVAPAELRVHVVERVRLLTLAPERVDLETCLYVLPDSPDAWEVRSPLGGPGGTWYRKKLQWATDQSLELAVWMAEWRIREVHTPDDYSVTDLASRLDFEFPALAGMPSLSNTREQLLTALQADTLFERDASNLDIVLLRYSKCLEALLQACIDAIPDKRGAARRCPGGMNHRVEQLANTLSFYLPNVYTRKHYETNKEFVDLIRYRKLQQREKVLLLLDYSCLEAVSPFRTALASDPDLLARIEVVANRRNEYAAHDTVTPLPIPPETMADEVRAATKKVVDVLATLLAQSILNQGSHTAN